MHHAVFRVVAGLQGYAAVAPQLALATEAIWRLAERVQQRCANEADRGNLAQRLGGVMLPALDQQLASLCGERKRKSAWL